MLDPTTGLLQARRPFERPHHRNKTTRFFQAIANGTWQLKPFFRRLIETSRNHPDTSPIATSSPVNYAHIMLDPNVAGTPLATLTMKAFRLSHMPPLTSLPSSYPHPPRACWRRLWLAPHPHKAHIILWRAYRNKLPCRHKLHALAPHSFNSPNGVLCGQVELKNTSCGPAPSNVAYGVQLPNVFFRTLQSSPLRTSSLSNRSPDSLFAPLPRHQFPSSSLHAPLSPFGMPTGGIFSITSLSSQTE